MQLWTWGIHPTEFSPSPGGQHLSNGVHYQLRPWRRSPVLDSGVKHGFSPVEFFGTGFFFWLIQKNQVDFSGCFWGIFFLLILRYFRCFGILWPVFGSTFFSSRFLIPLVFSKNVGVSFPIKKGPITAMSSVEKSPVVERNVPRRKWWNFYMWQ